MMISEWYCFVFVFIMLELKKNCDVQIKNVYCKVEKKYINQVSMFLNIRKKGMIWNFGLFFG